MVVETKKVESEKQFVKGAWRAPYPIRGTIMLIILGSSWRRSLHEGSSCQQQSMGCGSGDLSAESHDYVFSNGFERSNVLNLDGNAVGQVSSDQLSFPSPLVVVMKPRTWRTSG